jgi:hypothetical protein
MNNPCFTCASNLSSLEPRIGLAQYVAPVLAVNDAYRDAASIHDNYGDSHKLLEFDKLALGTT